MIRAFILYEREPDPERYQQHVEDVTKVECAAFRHGKVFGSPIGRARVPATTPSSSCTTCDAFKTAVDSAEFAAAGKDAMAMGIPFTRPLRVASSDRADAPAPASTRRSSASSRSSTRRRRRARRSA